MPSPGFDEVRKGHGEILHALQQLEDAIQGNGRAAAVDAFLDYARDFLMPFMRHEEELLVPLVARYLPAEAVSASSLRSEHATIGALLEALREARGREGEDAEADVAAAVSDLCLLLRDHVRREDLILHPLLQILAAGGPHE